MNLIIMPVQKSLVINALMNDNSIVVNLTNDRPIFKKGINIFDGLIELKDVCYYDVYGDLDEYSRIFFYTNLSYKDNIKEVESICNLFGENKCYFLFRN